MQGTWFPASTYDLVVVDRHGILLLTEDGKRFVAGDEEVTARIDEGEGLPRILEIIADRGPGRRRDFLPDWSEYLRRHSNFSSESTTRDTLSRRIRNLVDREMLARSGSSYRITDQGLAYLKRTGVETSEVEEIRDRIKHQGRVVRDALKSFLAEFDPYAFEHLIARLLEAMEYQNINVTKFSGDKGVDVTADIEVGITSVREVVQVKRHQAEIQRKDLDALRGSLHRFEAVRGTIITLGDFASGTRAAAFEPGVAPITLIDGEKLIDLLVEHGIGVQKRRFDVLEIDQDALVAISKEAVAAPDNGTDA